MNEMLAFDQDDMLEKTVLRMRAAGLCANGDRSVFEPSCTDHNDVLGMSKSYAGVYKTRAEELQLIARVKRI